MTNLENMSYIKDPICMGFVLSNGKANRIAKIMDIIPRDRGSRIFGNSAMLENSVLTVESSFNRSIEAIAALQNLTSFW